MGTWSQQVLFIEKNKPKTGQHWAGWKPAAGRRTLEVCCNIK